MSSSLPWPTALSGRYSPAVGRIRMIRSPVDSACRGASLVTMRNCSRPPSEYSTTRSASRSTPSDFPAAGSTTSRNAAFTVLIAEHDHHEFIGLAKRRGDLHLVAQLLEDDAEMLAFDHQRILIEAREHAGVLLEETNAALDLLPPVFTLAQLRGVYDAVWGTELDPGNFIKRVTRIEGFLEQLPLESDRPGEFASAPTAPDAEWVEYRTDSYLKSFAPTELPEEQSFERLSVLRPTASRGRPPRYFTAGGSRSLHPSLRRPGSYFSKPTRPSAPTD